MQKYQEKRHEVLDSNSAINIAANVLSDFEEFNEEVEIETSAETLKLT